MHPSSVETEPKELSSAATEPAWSDWEPAMELYEDDTAYSMILEVPGVPPHTLSIAQIGRTLVVTGIRPLHLDPGRLPHLEADYGRFSRRLDLPSAVQPALREVTIWRGLLIIRLPKCP